MKGFPGFRLFYLFPLVYFLASCAFPEPGPSSLQEHYASTRALVSLLWHGSIPSCTGTLVSLDGEVRFLSAGHCVAGNRVHQYSAFRSHPLGPLRLDLLAWKYAPDRWHEGDYALFSVRPKPNLPAARLCSRLPSPGTHVWTWVGPSGMEPVLQAGVYSGVARFPANPSRTSNGLHVLGFGVYQGASGAGVFYLETDTPCLWAVVAGYPKDIPSLSFVFPVVGVLGKN